MAVRHDIFPAQTMGRRSVRVEESVSPKCTSIFGHKFEARYDSELPRKDYIYDICTRCGETVKRNCDVPKNQS